jgi:excisionase family DNA binding protein
MMSSYADVYMTPDQVAERLQVDPETVRRWLRAKKLRASRISPKAWRVSERDLAAFMKQRESGSQFSELKAQTEQAQEKPNLAEFLRNSPLAGSGLVFERIKDDPRQVEL